MFYLINQNTDVVKASYKTLDDVVVNGFKVVPIPDFVAIDSDVTPFDEAELQQQKYEGLLLDYLDFDHVVYDILDDATGWDTGAAGTQGGVGNDRAWLTPNNGLLQTDNIDVSADGAFEDFLVYWDLYELTRTPNGDLTEIKYVEALPDMVNVSISNDGGSSFTPVVHTQPIELSAYGDQLALRFENTSASRYYIGGYAILY